jgi:hypothetical protein
VYPHQGPRAAFVDRCEGHRAPRDVETYGRSTAGISHHDGADDGRPAVSHGEVAGAMP